MQCDRCKKETTTYKYLGKNYCHPCNHQIYYCKTNDLKDLKEHIHQINEKLAAYAENQMHLFEETNQ